MDEKTPFDIKKINDYLYTLDYPYDYHLDEITSRGVDGTFQLLRTVQKLNHIKDPLTVSDEPSACTSFICRNAAGHYLFGRNLDFIDAPGLLIRCAPKNGYRSIAVTPFSLMLMGYKWQKNERSGQKKMFLSPFICMDGINECGLAISVLELRAKATKQQTGKPATTTTLIVRAVLDRCATVEEAIEEFKKYDMHSSVGYDYHFQLVDGTGASVIVEYINNELVVVRDQPYGTNYYFTEGGDNSKELGRDRAERVAAVLAEHETLESDAVLSLLESCKLCYRHKRGYWIKCLWSAVYDLTDPSVTLAVGMNYDTLFHFEMPPKKKEEALPF